MPYMRSNYTLTCPLSHLVSLAQTQQDWPRHYTSWLQNKSKSIVPVSILFSFANLERIESTAGIPVEFFLKGPWRSSRVFMSNFRTLDIVSCTNARASDFSAAAKVFKQAAAENNGIIPKIADGVQLYIAAASATEQEAAEAAGDWQTLIDAGAQPMPSGCAQCIGLGPGLLEAGEVSTCSCFHLVNLTHQCTGWYQC